MGTWVSPKFTDFTCLKNVQNVPSEKYRSNEQGEN